MTGDGETRYCYPVPEPRHVTSPYGPRAIDPATGRPQGFHPGVDLRAPKGAHVVHAGPVLGRVAHVEHEHAPHSTPNGNAVCVRTVDGDQVWYLHLSRIDVLPGQVIEVGDAIGLVGDSGYATGPHLHLQVYRPVGAACVRGMAQRLEPDRGGISTIDPWAYLHLADAPAGVFLAESKAAA